MRKWLIEFFNKFENRGIEIPRVNSILITKSINLPLFTLILNCFGASCDLNRFSVFSAFIEKSIVCQLSEVKLKSVMKSNNYSTFLTLIY